MLLDQLNSSRHRIAQILKLLRENHQFEFPLHEPHTWHSLSEQYAQLKSDILSGHVFNTYHTDPLYAKAVLITEAVKMLMEIAPRRMRKKVKESIQHQEPNMPQINEKAKKAKPDFLDVDKDGDKAESFKQALADKAKAHKLDEKWDAEMKTAPKDVGKWEGYTIAELKARKKKLMDKAERSDSEQKEVRQINFAIRAKQEDSWGKIKQESVLKEFEETIPSDEAFDKIKKAGGQSVKTRSDSISFVTKTGRHEVPHYYGAGGVRYVKVKDLHKALKELNASNNIQESTVDEGRQDPQTEKEMADAVANYKGPITVGKTKKLKGSQPYMIGTYHRDKTGSASADMPGVRYSSIPKMKLREDETLDKAETLLAAKDLSDRLQDMAEDAAKMAVDRLMPLVDTMKGQFGQPAAEGFNSVVKAQLQTVLDTIVAAKDATDNAILALQSGETPSDQASADITADLPAEPAVEPAPDAGEGEDIDFEKEFAAVPAASGPEEEPLGRARKADVSEAKKAKSPYAVGMAKAMELTGDEPPLKKSTIKKAHEIARGVEKSMHEQQLTECVQEIQQLIAEYNQLNENLQQHKAEFQASGAPDPLGLGRGWQGDALIKQMKNLAEQVNTLRAHKKHLQTQLLEHAHIQQLTTHRVQKLQQQLQETPYGVTGTTTQGTRVKQFFESAIARDMWLDYHKPELQQFNLVNPEHVQQVTKKLSRTLDK